MKIEQLVRKISELGIQTITGVPDSTLKSLCDLLRISGDQYFKNHVVAANEGAAVGIAIGEYLSCAKPACVYMQNSGLGNVINPVTSLTHTDVYGIPMLFIVGWRGEPGYKDEPQHKFMGKKTLDFLANLDIEYDIVNANCSENELNDMFDSIQQNFEANKSYALVIRKNTFEVNPSIKKYQNKFKLNREDAISTIIKWTQDMDIIVSTTGKISRELYEQCDKIKGNHGQAFLTVGGMGHANMIAYQIARNKKDNRVICIDGDGALLMHMGSLAVIGQNPVDNYVHICLNNEVHESVGSMPTGVSGMEFSALAKCAGYNRVYTVYTIDQLASVLEDVRQDWKEVFIEVFVSTDSRNDLGRPKESAQENKKEFMNYHGVKR